MGFKSGDKLVKIEKDRQVIAHFLIVMESRPQTSTNIEIKLETKSFL